MSASSESAPSRKHVRPLSCVIRRDSEGNTNHPQQITIQSSDFAAELIPCVDFASPIDNAIKEAMPVLLSSSEAASA
jgi:hypothetical protein